jgi:hypothetical protein
MVILEFLSKDFNEEEFDVMWDKIRYVYEEEFYSLKKIEKKSNKVLVKLNIIKQKQ